MQRIRSAIDSLLDTVIQQITSAQKKPLTVSRLDDDEDEQERLLARSLYATPTPPIARSSTSPSPQFLEREVEDEEEEEEDEGVDESTLLLFHRPTLEVQTESSGSNHISRLIQKIEDALTETRQDFGMVQRYHRLSSMDGHQSRRNRRSRGNVGRRIRRNIFRRGSKP